MNQANLVEAVHDNLLDSSRKRLSPSDPSGLKPINWLICAKKTHKPGVAPTQPRHRMDTKQRDPNSGRPQREEHLQRPVGIIQVEPLRQGGMATGIGLVRMRR